MQLRQDKMELNVIDETENSLFNRKEIIASVKSESSPKRREVIEEVNKCLNEEDES